MAQKFYSIGRDDQASDLLYATPSQAIVGYLFLMPATVAPRRLDQDFIVSDFDYTQNFEAFSDAPGFLFPNAWELPMDVYVGSHSEEIDINILRAIEGSALLTDDIRAIMLSVYETYKPPANAVLLYQFMSTIVDNLDENTIRDYSDLNLDEIEGVVPFEESNFYDNSPHEYGIGWGLVWLVIFNQYQKSGIFDYYAAVEMMDKILAVDALRDIIIKTRPSNIGTGAGAGGMAGWGNFPVPVFNNPVLNAPGWRNVLSSCFYHSTLAAVLLAQDSPFPSKILYDENIISRIRPEVADYRHALLEDLNVFLTGGNQTCSNSRNIFAQFLPEQDFAGGSNDPHEFYITFCDVFNYVPMSTIDISIRALSEDGTGSEVTRGILKGEAHLPKLDVWNRTLERIRWDDSWRTSFENVRSGTPDTWRRTEVEIINADAVVVYLSRSNPVVDMQGNVDENAVDPRGIIVDDIMAPILGNGETRKYYLKAVVFSPFNGHYAVLLNFDDVWYIYDDLASQNPQTKIGLQQQTLYDAMQIIQTRGTLFFYYPRRQ